MPKETPSKFNDLNRADKPQDRFGLGVKDIVSPYSVAPTPNNALTVGLPNPLDIFGADLVSWWDFSDSDNITVDGSNNISNVNDKSNNSRNFEQGTGGDQPLWVDSVRGEFDGSSEFLEADSHTSDFEALSAGSLFFRASKEAASERYCPFTIGNISSNSGRFLFLWEGSGETDANKIRMLANGSAFTDYDLVSDTTVVGGSVSVVITANGSTTRIFINGVESTITMKSGSNIGNWFDEISPLADSVRMGRTAQLATAFYTGSSRQVGIINRAITPAEVTTLTEYLDTK